MWCVSNHFYNLKNEKHPWRTVMFISKLRNASQLMKHKFVENEMNENLYLTSNKFKITTS